MFAFAIFLSMYVIVMSSAYVMSFSGVGMSDVYMLNSLGDKTPPCGAQFLNFRCVDVLLLYVM